MTDMEALAEYASMTYRKWSEGAAREAREGELVTWASRAIREDVYLGGFLRALFALCRAGRRAGRDREGRMVGKGAGE